MTTVHTHRVPVRWSDFDRYGHLMNANYIELAQEARLIFAQDRIYPTLPKFAAYVRKLEVDYQAPIVPQGNPEVVVETSVTNIGNTSFTTLQEIYDCSGVLACTIECVQVAVDLNTGTRRSLTDEEKEILQG